MEENEKKFAITIGATVYVRSLKSNALVKSISPSGKVKVFCGSITIEVALEELSPPSASSNNKSSTINYLKTSRKDRADASMVDLHGMTVIEALHALEATLSRALMANIREFRVIHGIGTGRVQSAVREYLSRQPLVTSFMADPWNVGVTRVFL